MLLTETGRANTRETQRDRATKKCILSTPLEKISEGIAHDFMSIIGWHQDKT
jgi:hypothetical protein